MVGTACITWEQVSCRHLFAGQGWCPDGVKDPWRSDGYYNKWGAPRPLTAVILFRVSSKSSRVSLFKVILHLLFFRFIFVFKKKSSCFFFFSTVQCTKALTPGRKRRLGWIFLYGNMLIAAYINIFNLTLENAHLPSPGLLYYIGIILFDEIQ